MTVTTPPGEVLLDGDGVVLRFDRVVPAAVERVWAALADPATCALWYGAWTGDPASGSVLVTMSAEEGAPVEEVAVEECLPHTRLVVVLGVPGTGVWRVALDLAPAPAGTALSFTQRFASAQDAAGAAPGWHYYLDRMTSAVLGEPVAQQWSDYERLGG